MRSSPVTHLLLAIALSTAGCASTQAGRSGESSSDADEETKAPQDVPTEKATFDLNCPESKLEWTRTGPQSRGVVGCGRQARYIARCSLCGEGQWVKCHCLFRLEGDVRSVPDSEAAAKESKAEDGERDEDATERAGGDEETGDEETDDESPNDARKDVTGGDSESERDRP